MAKDDDDYGPTPTPPAAPKKATNKTPTLEDLKPRHVTRAADSESFTDKDLALETKGPLASESEVSKNLSRQTAPQWRRYQAAREKAERVLSNNGRKYTTGRR